MGAVARAPLAKTVGDVHALVGFHFLLSLFIVENVIVLLPQVHGASVLRGVLRTDGDCGGVALAR